MIVFDLDPRQTAGDTSFGAIVTFMRFLADATGKECVLTPEGGHDIALHSTSHDAP